MKTPVVKKILLILLAIAIFGAMYFFMPTDLISAVSIKEAKVYVYCRDFNGECINNGSGCIVATTVGEYSYVVKNASSITGVSIEFVGSDSDVAALLDRLQVTIYSSDVCIDIVSLYGYSPRLTGGVMVDGNLINIHIAKSGEVISIGSPLILGSF